MVKRGMRENPQHTWEHLFWRQ